MEATKGDKDLTPNEYDKAYYENGTKSCYVRYRWLPESTASACHAMCLQLPITVSESIIDVGCAKGYYVAAWRLMLHRQAWGVDVSSYAISQAHPTSEGYLAHSPDGKGIVWPGPFSWAIAKDCLEHCEEHEVLPALLEDISRKCERIFVVVPLADAEGKFIARAEERDASHKIRRDGGWWYDTISKYYNDVQMTHQFAGLKDAWRFIKGAHAFLVGRDSRAG